eukprot:Em0067g18a
MDVLNAIGDIFYGGIQPNIPGNGGPDCVAFLSKGQLLFETLLGTALVVLFSLCGAKTYTLPAKVASVGKDPLFKKVLLVVLSVVFAIEIAYKVCSRQLLYLLNPCHVCTVLEIYLLLSKPRRIAFAVLRFLVHYIYEAAIALLFPETDCRLFVDKVYTLVVKFVLYLLSSKWRKRL